MCKWGPSGCVDALWVGLLGPGSRAVPEQMEPRVVLLASWSSRHSAGVPILQTREGGHSCEAACSLTRHALGLSLGQAATGARRARCTY